MNLEDLGNLGELIAAIATLGTLIYLALQIKQNSESVRVTAGQAILSSLNDALQMASSSSQAARVLVLGQTDFDKLPEDEKAQYLVWVFSWFRVLEQAHHYNKKGYLDDEVWEGHVEHMKLILSMAHNIKWWESRKPFFSMSFREFVDQVTKTKSDVPPLRDLMNAISN